MDEQVKSNIKLCEPAWLNSGYQRPFCDIQPLTKQCGYHDWFRLGEARLPGLPGTCSKSDTYDIAASIQSGMRCLWPFRDDGTRFNE